MCALRLIAETLPRVSDKLFSRKYIRLGRIVTNWRDIIGKKMAHQAQPIKLHVRKIRQNGKKAAKGQTQATLEIATSSANATLLTMQKGVILERINQIFGSEWITDLKFTHIVLDPPQTEDKAEKTPLKQEKAKYLSDLLADIDDPDIKNSLESLGKALLHHKQIKEQE